MNNIFLFSFFLSALTCCPASSTLLRFHFYCYYYYRWCYYYCLLGFSLCIAKKLLLFHRHSQTRTIIKCPIWPSGNQLDADRESSFDQKTKTKTVFLFKLVQPNARGKKKKKIVVVVFKNKTCRKEKEPNKSLWLFFFF
jgi:hypothetical protein